MKARSVKAGSAFFIAGDDNGKGWHSSNQIFNAPIRRVCRGNQRILKGQKPFYAEQIREVRFA